MRLDKFTEPCAQGKEGGSFRLPRSGATMIEEQDSEFIRHEPCPSCGSSDALARYTDGHAHCFSCRYYEFGDGKIVPFHKPQAPVDFTGDIIPLKSRGILEDTCKKFNVRYDSITRTLKFPYHNGAGRLVAFKARTPDKNFSWTGGHCFFCPECGRWFFAFYEQHFPPFGL